MAEQSAAPGTLFCDTNILVRLLTNQPLERAEAVHAALDVAARTPLILVLPDVVVAELAYVLTEVYRLSVADAADRIGMILDLAAIEVVDESLLRDTLSIWRAGRLDFTDAYLAALGRGTREAGVLSFDRDFDRVADLFRVDPAALTA
jgi:predicted nucleic acid-binding protein